MPRRPIREEALALAYSDAVRHRREVPDEYRERNRREGGRGCTHVMTELCRNTSKASTPSIGASSMRQHCAALASFYFLFFQFFFFLLLLSFFMLFHLVYPCGL